MALLVELHFFLLVPFYYFILFLAFSDYIIIEKKVIIKFYTRQQWVNWIQLTLFTKTKPAASVAQGCKRYTVTTELSGFQ